MIDYALREMMPDTVTIEDRLGFDAFSKPIYGPPVTYSPPNGARIELRRSLVRDMDGREVVSSTTIFLATTVPVRHTARVTFEVDGVLQTPSIVSIESVRDEDGSYVTKLFT